RGRWPGILAALGIPAQFLTGKNGPCPFCGGKDRYRFTDHNGDGLYYCNQCGSQNGIGVVMKFFQVPFIDAAVRIESVLGGSRANTGSIARARRHFSCVEKSWSRLDPISREGLVHRWLRSRGIDLLHYPASLRSSSTGCHPAMVALVSAVDGTPRTLHRT